jgi:hypothetical protein
MSIRCLLVLQFALFIALPAATAATKTAEYYSGLQQIYVGYFGRPADPAGLDYFAGIFLAAGAPTDIAGMSRAYQTNPTVASLIDSFSNSNESRDLYPGNNAVFVAAIYQNIFSRQADDAGKAFWVDLLDRGLITRANAALAILAGARGSDTVIVSNKVAAAEKFTQAVNTTERAAAYSGTLATSVARTMLQTVSASTDLLAFTETVDNILGQLVLALYKVKLRDVPQGREFYSGAEATTFVPRGSNFVRLAPLTNFGGGLQTTHSTFSVGYYDGDAAGAALKAMSAEGYNTVRVFLSVCCIGTLSMPTGGINSLYVANLTDFLRRAKANGIRVLITSDGWLVNGYPQRVEPGDDNFSLINYVYFSAGGVLGSSAFWTDLIAALRMAGAPLENVLAYSVANEAFGDTAAEPLSQSSGMVTTANGKAYDMGDPVSRSLMVSDGVVYFAEQVGAAIRKADPTALVTLGFFPPNSPNIFLPGDTRVVPKVFPAFESSTVDFIDLHPYPVFSINFAQQAENFGIQDRFSKLVIIGEYGDSHALDTTVDSAALRLRDWQVQSCQFGASGWLVWTWDSENDLWSASSDGGEIGWMLSPFKRPNPCIP